ncbi:unnamed protein product [Schistosoma curassoni]|uniref:Uncharacterized protein n=1 Tax=Schistosoma curassoni TaxID=6186 RepID=A0A183JQ36_9TREM|nr:unnamed protein product [Schistosoma curassoni]
MESSTDSHVYHSILVDSNNELGHRGKSNIRSLLLANKPDC